MIEIYDGTELARERKQKKIRIAIWWTLTAIVFALNVGLYVYFCLQPYQWSGRTALFWIQIANVTVYACASFFYLSVKHRRRRAYCKMLKNMQTGLKEIYTGEYLGTSLNTEYKEGVEFYVLLVMEFNANKQVYFERKVLLDVEKEIPPLHEGDILHFVTQANMLAAYEVLPRPENEPTLEQKRHQMAAKDKERLFDNVIIDEEAASKLKRKKRRKVRFEDAPVMQTPEAESKTVIEGQAEKEGQEEDQTK